ncbi:MAG: hypothetical protein HQK50_12000, partial [Oligoflexia bacterium]|nr:hypothetical protein [Oligoflexia bacterium]
TLLFSAIAFLFSLNSLTLFSQETTDAQNNDRDFIEQNWNKFVEISNKSLTDNIITLSKGQFLTAGQHQFKTLWTRDFCYSVRGLIPLKKYAVIKNHLNYLIDHIREKDNQAPVFADSMNPKKRAAWVSLSHIFRFIRNLAITDNISVYYESVHGYPTIDANMLILMASLDYSSSGDDPFWWESQEEKLVKIYRYYDKYFKDGLIYQGPFADWQDSVYRNGHTFLTNLLYYVISQRLLKFPAFQVSEDDLKKLRKKIELDFFDQQSGLYRTIKGAKQISIDGNLLAIDLKYHHPDSPEAINLYAALKRSPLWVKYGLPGIATSPNYPKKWQYRALRSIGLGNYHGEMFWSWTLALSIKVAYLMNDKSEGNRIMATLMKMILRDKAVGEIYSPNPRKNYPNWRSRFYWSESPFSWGSAFVVDLIDYVNDKGPGKLFPNFNGAIKRSTHNL